MLTVILIGLIICDLAAAWLMWNAISSFERRLALVETDLQRYCQVTGDLAERLFDVEQQQEKV